MTIDPIIRFENNTGQLDEVNEEKINIYISTIPFYKDKYHLENIRVTRLMIGALYC